MIYDRNKFIMVTVSYDYIYDSLYTCHDYHMIFNRKGREATAPTPRCIHHPSSVAGGDDAIMSSSISIEQMLDEHANSSSPARAALKTIPAERNNRKELAIVEPPQRTVTQLLLCVKRCQKVEGWA